MAAEKGLFVVQLPAKQWQNFSKRLDRCFLRADRPQNKLWMAWSGHTKIDGTSAGNSSQTIKKVLQQEGVWGKKAISGWRPILGFAGAQSLSAKNETHFSRNCAATMKTRQRSCQHAKDLASGTLLPPTGHVEWAWRKKKMHAIWCATTELRNGRNTGNSSAEKTFDTIHKE